MYGSAIYRQCDTNWTVQQLFLNIMRSILNVYFKNIINMTFAMISCLSRPFIWLLNWWLFSWGVNCMIFLCLTFILLLANIIFEMSLSPNNSTTSQRFFKFTLRYVRLIFSTTHSCVKLLCSPFWPRNVCFLLLYTKGNVQKDLLCNSTSTAGTCCHFSIDISGGRMPFKKSSLD